MVDVTHAVWDIYDLLRTARLNAKYYAGRLHKVERLNFVFELILLVSAPSSAIAGLWFWDNPVGKEVWQWLGCVAALVAVLKPLLGLTKKIKEYEVLLSGYRGLEHDLREIRIMVAQTKKYDRSHQAEFKKALKRQGALAAKDPDTREDKTLKQRCEKEVLEEFPIDQFYVPAES